MSLPMFMLLVLPLLTVLAAPVAVIVGFAVSKRRAELVAKAKSTGKQIAGGELDGSISSELNLVADVVGSASSRFFSVLTAGRESEAAETDDGDDFDGNDDENANSSKTGIRQELLSRTALMLLLTLTSIMSLSLKSRKPSNSPKSIKEREEQQLRRLNAREPTTGRQKEVNFRKASGAGAGAGAAQSNTSPSVSCRGLWYDYVVPGRLCLSKDENQSGAEGKGDENAVQSRGGIVSVRTAPQPVDLNEWLVHEELAANGPTRTDSETTASSVGSDAGGGVGTLGDRNGKSTGTHLRSLSGYLMAAVNSGSQYVRIFHRQYELGEVDVHEKNCEIHTIVFSHGFSTPSFVFEPLVRNLLRILAVAESKKSAGTKRKWRVMVYDQPGRGLSDRFAEPSGSAASAREGTQPYVCDRALYASVLQQVVNLATDGRGDNVHVVGYSMGAATHAAGSAQIVAIQANVKLIMYSDRICTVRVFSISIEICTSPAASVLAFRA